MKIKHVIILLIGICLIICAPLFIKDNGLITILTISQTLFAFITLVLAIVLFDRYQVGTKLNNETVDLIIEYIKFLKSVTLLIQEYTYDEKVTKIGFRIVNFNKDSVSNVKKSSKKMYVDFETYIGFYRELTKFINSPWMPKEIFEMSCMFDGKFVMKTYEKNKLKEDFFVLNFVGYESALEDELVVMLDGIDSCEKLSKNIEKLLAGIEKWIKNQAADINIRM